MLQSAWWRATSNCPGRGAARPAGGARRSAWDALLWMIGLTLGTPALSPRGPGMEGNGLVGRPMRSPPSAMPAAAGGRQPAPHAGQMAVVANRRLLVAGGLGFGARELAGRAALPGLASGAGRRAAGWAAPTLPGRADRQLLLRVRHAQVSRGGRSGFVAGRGAGAPGRRSFSAVGANFNTVDLLSDSASCG